MGGVWICCIGVGVAAIMVMALASGVSAEDCGSQAGGTLCPGGLCCSQWGWCGTTPQYCDSNQGCQSQCTTPTPPPPPPSPSPPGPQPPTPTPTPPSGEGVGSILSEEMFDSMLLHRIDPACQGSFYTYPAFLSAAESYPDFGNEGSLEIRKREIAAFLAQTSHETTGGWPTAPDGPYTWGYCFIEEVNAVDPYCLSSDQWPCADGKKYYGRGPIQLSWNYNYGPAGVAIGFDGINNPEVVANDPTISFKTALWFWMTPQSPKPSCHDVMVGEWTPSNDDEEKGRLSGYGMTTNIINGGLECGQGTIIPKEEDRIGFFERYCSLFDISPGDNLSCEHQTSYSVTSHSPQDEDLIRQVTVS